MGELWGMAGKASFGGQTTGGFIKGAPKYPERDCAGCIARNFRNRVACRICGKAFPRSWIEESQAAAANAGKREGAWTRSGSNATKHGGASSFEAEVLKKLAAMQKAVDDVKGARSNEVAVAAAGTVQPEAGSKDKDKLAAVQAAERALAAVADMGLGKDDPVHAHLEQVLEQRRKEYREGKPDVAQVGAAARKLEALEKKNGRLEQDIAAKVAELERGRAALVEMQQQKAANEKAIRALREEVGNVVGRMGASDARGVLAAAASLPEQDLAANPDVAEMLRSPAFAKWHGILAAREAATLPVCGGDDVLDIADMEPEAKRKCENLGPAELEAWLMELRGCPVEQIGAKIAGYQIKRRKEG